MKKQKKKKHRQVGFYFRSDYIGKELIKSFFTGTLAYILFFGLWAIANWERFMESLNNVEIASSIVMTIVLYIGFMAMYLFATLMLYTNRYAESKKKLAEYKENLKVINQMYDREEKLKL